jgi:hypothetical protein
MRALPRNQNRSELDDLALESDRMPAFGDWFPLAAVGLTFTVLGSLKLWGLKQGIVGGAGKPFTQRLCGT